MKAARREETFVGGNRKRTTYICRAVILLVAFSLPFASDSIAVAQSTASIFGTVRDATGGAIPGASIKVINLDTNFSRQALTADNGTYTVTLLPVGRYRLEAEMPGFRRYIQEGVTLTVNDKITVDIALQIGEVTDSVTVESSAPLLEAQTGTLRGLVDKQRMESLPLNGRDMNQPVSIQGGVIQTSNRTSSGEGISYAVNGSRQNGVYYLLDGGYNTNTYRNFSGVFPNPDAVQEFSVEKSNFTAEYANATGAVVNVITKSGTNEFHGSAFWFVRNAALNARNFFAERRDSLKRNQFGATLGGPIIGDRFFFFGAYQGTSLRSDPGLTRQFLPTSAMRSGDFSAISSALVDPLTGITFPNNQIPVERFSPVTVNFLKYVPVPASADGQRFISAPSRIDVNEYTARLDVDLRQHRLSGKFFRSLSEEPFYADPNDVAAPLVRNATQPYRHLSINHLYTIAPNLINNATFAYRYRARMSVWGSFRYPIDFQKAGVGDIAVQDPPGFRLNVSGFFNISPTWPYEIEDTDWHWTDTFTAIRGEHQIKIGGEVIRSRNQIRNHFRTMGDFTFNGFATGHAMADFMLGEAFRFLQGGGEYKDLSGYRYGFFVQDDFRVTPNLTLNLGLRWDPMVPLHDTLGRVQCFRPGIQSERFPNAPEGYLNGGDPSCPDGGFDSYFPALAPRLGVAWRPGGSNTVLRGGVGIFWNPQFTVLYNGFVNSAPFSPQIERFGIKLDAPYAGAANPFPEFFAPFDPPRDSEFFLPLGTFGSFASDFRPSYMITFNLTAEREMASNLVGRVSYIGNLGRRLSYDQDINYARYVAGNSTPQNLQDRRPYRDFGTILLAESGSNSSYHGLQFSVERRYSNFAFEANYTWSKSIDEYSADPTPGQSSSLSIPYNRRLNRGLSDFDVPHRFVASYVSRLPELNTQSKLLRSLLGGWETSGIVTLQSGSPFSVLSGRDNASSGINRDYADLKGNPHLDAGRPRSELIAEYFNTAGFAPNAPGTFGTASRNLLRGPGYINFDLALIKKVDIGEAISLQFRSEFFNAFNRPNFNNPFSTQRVSGRFGKIESAGDPRIIQFALRLTF